MPPPLCLSSAMRILGSGSRAARSAGMTSIRHRPESCGAGRAEGPFSPFPPKGMERPGGARGLRGPSAGLRDPLMRAGFGPGLRGLVRARGPPCDRRPSASRRSIGEILRGEFRNCRPLPRDAPDSKLQYAYFPIPVKRSVIIPSAAMRSLDSGSRCARPE